MCGRYTLRTPIPELARLFRVDRLEVEELPARYNIAPTQPVAVVRHEAAAAGGGTGAGGATDAGAPGGRERALGFLRWGLVPGWVEDPREWPTLINARAESLDRKPAFRDAVRDRRCLVVADGFYEWRREDGKQPYLVRLASGEPFAFAGLWERWTGRVRGEDTTVDSCAIVTTDANDLLRPLHDRMPVILRPEDWETWLDPDVRHPADLEALLRPLPSELLAVHPVSRRVNRPDEDDPGVVEPAGDVARRPEDLTPPRGGDGGGTGSGRAEPGDVRASDTDSSSGGGATPEEDPQLDLL